MAQPTIKISALPAANEPLTGSELVPVVQGGITSRSTTGYFLNPTNMPWTQNQTGAVTRNVNVKLDECLSVLDFGAVGNGVVDDTAAIQTAVTAAQASGKALYVPAGIYAVQSVTVSSGLRMFGDTPTSSVFKQQSVGDAIFSNYTSSTKTNISFENLGFDVNLKDTGINIKNVVGFTARNCYFDNIQTWGICIGIDDARASTTTITSSDILIENCRFKNIVATFEHLLLYNAKNIVVRDCNFELATTFGVGIGLYQNLSGVTVDSCQFTSLSRGLYYAVTTNEIVISNCRFDSCNIAIQGANESDQGLFGQGWVYGLFITGCYFTNSGNIACEIGAVFDGAMTDCYFANNVNNALVFSYGNRLATPTINQDINFSVTSCHFLNNNTSGLLSILHPAVLFNEGGGTMYITFTGCTFADTQGSPTQLYPVVFSGAFTWSTIRFVSCRMASYGGGASIALTGGAALSDVRLLYCTSLSALPAGVSSYTGSVSQLTNDAGYITGIVGGSAVQTPGGDGAVYTPKIETLGSTFGNTLFASVFYNTVATGAGAFTFARSNTTTIGTHALVASGDVIGTLYFAGSDGVAFRRAAYITASVDGTPAASDMPGKLSFYTTPSGSTTPVSRIEVKSTGAVNFVPQTTPATAAAGDVYYDSGTNKLRCYNGAIWNDLF